MPIQLSGTLANRFPILVLLEVAELLIPVFISSAVRALGWPRETNCTNIIPATRVMKTTVFLLFICAIIKRILPLWPVRQHGMNSVLEVLIQLLKILIPNQCIYILQILDRKHIYLLAGDHLSAADIALW